MTIVFTYYPIQLFKLEIYLGKLEQMAFYVNVLVMDEEPQIKQY